MKYSVSLTSDEIYQKTTHSFHVEMRLFAIQKTNWYAQTIQTNELKTYKIPSTLTTKIAIQLKWRNITKRHRDTQNRLPYCVVAAKTLATKQKDSKLALPYEMKSNPYTHKNPFIAVLLYSRLAVSMPNNSWIQYPCYAPKLRMIRSLQVRFNCLGSLSWRPLTA